MLEINEIRSKAATKACTLHIEIRAVGMNECKKWYGNSNYSIMLKRIPVEYLTCWRHLIKIPQSHWSHSEEAMSVITFLLVTIPSSHINNLILTSQNFRSRIPIISIFLYIFIYIYIFTFHKE